MHRHTALDGHNQSSQRDRQLIIIVTIAMSLCFLGFALLLSPPSEILRGELTIIKTPGLLITDYFAVAPPGAVMFNAGIINILAGLAAWGIKARFNGYLLAGIFTVSGFGFFGKNPFSIIPIMLGVQAYALVTKRRPADLVAPMLFGTTMAPLVGQVAFGFNWGWQGIATAVLLGIAGGFLVAALVGHVFQMHLGYSLYNTGITGGFVCLIMYMMMRGYGIKIAPSFLWSTLHTEALVLFVSFVLLMLLLLGVYCNGSMPAYRNLLKTSGKLSSDFVELFGMGTTLINMSIVGTIALGYVLFVGGVLNGPALAGILTVTGFGALGKHPRNIVPIMLGVYLVCLPKIWSPADPGPLLAALFCTNLAPLAGQFGFWAGVIAGAVHLPMAMHVGSIYGFLNLYNNGFAGGIAAMVIIGFLKGVKPDILDRRKPWYILSD